FTVSNVSVISFDLPANSYNASRIRNLVAGLEDGLRTTADLQPHGFARTAPFANGHWWTSFRLRGEDRTHDRLIETQEIAADYLSVLGLPIVAGRGFEPSDAGRAILVNETFARRYLGDGPAVGKEIIFGGKEIRQIAGVVKDAYTVGLDSIQPLLYESV